MADYPQSIPPYNLWRYNIIAEQINTGEKSVVAIESPTDFFKYLFGAMSVLSEVNAIDGDLDNRQSAVDIYNNEVSIVALCEALADCIENNPDVQNAINNYLMNTNYGANASTTLGTYADENLLSGNCDLDAIYGFCVAIEDYTYATAKDMVETVLDAPLDILARSRLVDYVPVLGDLPLADDINDFVTQMRLLTPTTFDNGYSTTIRQENICSMFERACGTCELSGQDVVEIYGLRAGMNLDASTVMSRLIIELGFLGQDTAVVALFQSIVAMALATGNKLQGFGGIPSFQQIAQSGDADGDWSIFCNPCPGGSWVYTVDFTQQQTTMFNNSTIINSNGTTFCSANGSTWDNNGWLLDNGILFGWTQFTEITGVTATFDNTSGLTASYVGVSYGEPRRRRDNQNTWQTSQIGSDIVVSSGQISIQSNGILAYACNGSGTSRIKSLTVTGNGYNPFV